MKKLFFSLHIFTISVLLFSCTKTDTGLTANDPKPTNVLKATTTNSGGMSGREAATPPTSTCAPTVVTLFAGQTIDAGIVTVSNDANFIYVTYNTANGYVLTQTHLYVGECTLIPVNGPGNPMPGQFPYAAAHNDATTYTYTIPVMAIPVGSCGCIAAHCNLVKYNAAGQIIDTQSGWGFGTRINPKGNWGTKFAYCSCQ